MEYLVLFIFGAMMGSFMAATAYRQIQKVPLFSQKRSFCDKCKTQINWYDNIPVFSYIFLRGRCRNCETVIPKRYLLMEIFSGLSFASLPFVANAVAKSNLWFSALPLPTLYLVLILLLCFSLYQIYFDALYMYLSDFASFAMFLLGVFLLFYFPNNVVWNNLFASFTFATVFLILHLATYGKGMGLGDVKLALFPPLFLSMNISILWLFLSFVIGALYGLPFLLLGKKKMTEKIAFGPFMVVSFWVCLLFGKEIFKFLFPYF